jgi:glutamine phosphoribosylpyrophosphate amidotransferase
MCGVLGIAIKKPSEQEFDLVRQLFIQSMIRGKHATGVSYVKDNKVHTIKEPIPANQFIEKQNLQDWVNEDGNLYCIGHVRYSTSDLAYNQPMATEELSIAHNGVISQEPPETWKETYGYETETKNDSELILRCLENNEKPLKKFVPSSMSVCTIDNNKIITAFRNEARPLYRFFSSNKIIFASTEDILKRSKIQDAGKTPMYGVFTVDNFHVTGYNSYSRNHLAEDLQ